MNHFHRTIFLVFSFIFASCESKFDVNQISEKLFTEIPAAYSNLTFENNVVQTKKNNHLLNVEFVSGGGVAVGDINNDGLEDLFFTGNQVSDRLYLNKGDLVFEDISNQAGISQDDGWSTSVTFVDVDQDGDQDIYVCRFIYLENDLSANQLYINNGDLTFTEKAAQFGIADKGFSTNATFCDFDKDNLVDLYVVNQPPSIPGRRGKISRTDLPGIQFSDRYYRNAGNGTFVDETEKSNVRNFGFGLSALVGDFNDDTWQDIYVSNDFDVADHLYINNKDGTFSDQIKQFTKHITNFSMGSDAADYDNDGHLDMMVVDMVHEDKQMRKSHMTYIDTRDFLNNVSLGVHYQYMTNTLQRNNGNGTFSELARLAGVDKTGWSWGPLFADFDNDGIKDLFITNGVIRNNLHSDLAATYQQKVDSLRNIARLNNRDPRQLIDVFDFVDLAAMDAMPNYLYRNNGDHTFSNMSLSWGLDKPTTSNGASYADFDLDGDLDLVVNNLNGPVGLYKNNAVENGKGNFVRILLNASKNQSVYGAKVSIFRKGEFWQMSHVINTRGFRSKSENAVHFGVGKESEISKVVVEWQNGSYSELENVQVNEVYTIDQSDATPREVRAEVPQNRIFKELSALPQRAKMVHTENSYNDFSREVLLPFRLSCAGPTMAVGDINGDGREDFYVGGSAGYPGKMFMQRSSGGFALASDGAWLPDAACEDADAEFVDVDRDGDLDLVVVSGGNEFDPGDQRYVDRLYINDGRGNFRKEIAGMPDLITSSSCVRVCDFDSDGDEDLFIGGRLIPRKYPNPANSYLLENRGGSYIDITADMAPDMEALGLVTSACWTDHNDDGRYDLVVVGEWMPITAFTQKEDGSFRKEILKGLENSDGWYFDIHSADIDDDGDQDLVVGNLGLNYSYSATVDSPLHLFAYDFDLNGSNDLVLGYDVDGILYPSLGRDRAALQIPSLEKTFPSFASYSKATLQEIYGEALDRAQHVEARTFASAYIENLGNGIFKSKPLPSLAQASVINAILVRDFNHDGHKDILVAGNLYQTEIEVPRQDAGTGLLLTGNGNGSFEPVSIAESGFFAPGDVKDMHFIIINEKQSVLVGNNNDFLQIFEQIHKNSNL